MSHDDWKAEGDGVPIGFMVAAVGALEEEFGARMMGPAEAMRELMSALESARAAYQKLLPTSGLPPADQPERRPHGAA